MSDDLVIPGLARWLPLDLGADPAEYAERLLAEYPQTPAGELVASGVAGMAGQLRRAADEAEETGDSVLVAAWLFLTGDDDLRPLAHATMQGVRLEPADQTPERFVALLLEEERETYQQPEVRDLATASGPATYLRYRPVVHEEGERRVHERTVVFWLRPARAMAVMLTAYADDLVVGADVPDALAQLAEGVSGL